MERPWLILRRVLDVRLPGDDDDMLADADPEEQAAAVGEAEADAQAQEQQHAAVAQAQAEEDAQAQEEQHAAAVDVAMWAQDEQQAAVGEDEDEEQDPQAQLEESVLDVNTNLAAAEDAHAAMGAGGPDFTITVAPPPRVSSLITGPSAHPDPARPDMFPYIIATGPFCLLVHFANAPSYGTNFGQQPNHSHLVVVRHFLRDDDGAQIAACALHIPDRPYDDFIDMPALSSIESVGLVCNQDTGHYQIAELIVTTGAQEAVVVYIRTDAGDGVWQGNSYANPLFVENRLRDWVPHGTVTIESTVFWYDLSWGIISCDLAQPHLLRVLTFHRLPRGRVLRAGAGAMPDLHCRRCIAVSQNLVRYVEIIVKPNQAATVNMWYRDEEDNPSRWVWITNYKESFAGIWDDESYAQTGLPRNPPMLAGVSPVNSSVVYFTLNQRLFGVNVPEHRVVHCEDYEPLNSPGPADEPVTSRYLITWSLDDDGEINVGHYQPGDHSDHEDSGDSGPMDEGEIDYQTP